MFIELTFISYIIDRIFGEFKFIKSYIHPVIYMGRFITWFEKYFYKDSISRGAILTFSLIILTYFIVSTITQYISNSILLGILGSTTISAKMLKKAVKDIIKNPSNIKYLVSRDTKNLSKNDINKAAIETYSENLSDGVIAPLFYMLLFGLYGAFIYKAINTLDSMVGYRISRYEKFGKVSAKLDDIVNLIPSRISAILIAIYFNNIFNIKQIYKFANLHESPNAGYPISAMALSLGVKLGGPTSYFGKIKNKPYFGEGKKKIRIKDIKKAIKFNQFLDITLLLLLIILLHSHFS